MASFQTAAAGALVAVCGMAVLIGWVFDLTQAMNLMSGWRLMAAGTAMSFVFIGLALVLLSRMRTEQVHLTAVRASALASIVIPVVTLVEYVTGWRTGIEGWLGVSFETMPTFDGRMSPDASICFLVIGLTLAAMTVPSATARTVAALGAGATLLTTWMAILVVALDTARLNDVGRFPGMAVLTIALMTISSAATLELALTRDNPPDSRGLARGRFAALLAAACAVPLFLGWLRAALQQRLPEPMGTSMVVFLAAGGLTLIVWRYARRLVTLTHERERAFAELEQRVAERTSELAARNEALRQSEDLLREADRRKNEFLATLAHELRNPLAPIRNAVALLRSEGAAAADRRDARMIIDRQVAQMARLVDDLLDVSRITAGKLKMRMARLDLRDALNLAVTTARPHLDEAGHRLTLVLPLEPMMIEGDEVRLSQVFANLLHNACKYTEPGGEIALEVSRPTPADVEVVVRDNGIGIPPEFLPRLFEKFSQVAPALDRSQGGLGLGLALVQGIVTLHGGQVDVRSDGPGRGSAFAVRLPISLALPTTVRAVAPEPERGSVSRRVLVVDDNADGAEAMAMLLRFKGHHVQTAHDGVAAIAAAERFHPEAILLDIGIPGLNGYQVCERIRAQAWGRGMLIVAQTGWGQAQDRARSQAAGFDAHLTKPVDPDVVQDLLVSARGADSSRSGV
jgi:signal transduction histidine kinase/CheY-like chemotaxis protein